jgi:hypothetical protein
VIDFASCWVELGAWIAAEPNRGRQATLVKMAELAAKHTVTEDDVERVVRVYGPQLLDELANRLPAGSEPGAGASGEAVTTVRPANAISPAHRVAVG